MVIELPPPDQVQWYTLKSYEGIAVTDEADAEKPIFSVKVEITRPGQTLSLYAESSIKAKDKDMKVLKRPPLLYSERSRYDDVDKRIGYTPGNIKEFVQVQDTKDLEKELMLGHGDCPTCVAPAGSRTFCLMPSVTSPEPARRSTSPVTVSCAVILV